MDTLRARAEQGDSDAAVSLRLLLSGSVLPDSRRRSYENPVEAVRWFRHAAEMGNVDGMRHLATALNKGSGVLQDDVEADHWYRRAAEMGDTLSMSGLGIMYSEPGNGAHDDVEAHMWFNLYLIRLDPRRSSWAQWGRGKRNALASRMTPAQITEVQRCAREWQAAHPC